MKEPFLWAEIAFQWDESYRCYVSSDKYIRLYPGFKISNRDLPKWDVWFGFNHFQVDIEDPCQAVAKVYKIMIEDLERRAQAATKELSVLSKYNLGIICVGQARHLSY